MRKEYERELKKQIKPSIQPKTAFDLTKNPGSEWANSNPRMQIAQIYLRNSMNKEVMDKELLKKDLNTLTMIRNSNNMRFGDICIKILFLKAIRKRVPNTDFDLTQHVDSHVNS